LVRIYFGTCPEDQRIDKHHNKD